MEQSLKNSDRLSESVSLKDFKMLKMLGQGLSSKVFLVEKLGGIDSGTLYAMKAINKVPLNRFDAIQLKMERDILTTSKYRFFAKLFYAFQTKERAYLVMEFFQGGDLFNRLLKVDRLSECDAKFYLAEIAVALQNLHAIQIIYRDLKPENILIGNDGHIVLTDFGLSGIDGLSRDQCGTLDYMAPEMFSKKIQTTAVDWWSFGVLMHVMLSAKTLFDGADDEETRRNISNGTPKISGWLNASANLFIRQSVCKDPKDRLGSGGIEEIMGHPFFDSVDWMKVVSKEMTPPFVPTFKDASDLQYFESEITSIEPRESEGVAACPAIQDLFDFGFDWIEPSLQSSNGSLG